MADTKLRTPQATSLLKDDHRRVKDLFASYDRLEEGDEPGKKRLFEQIKIELTIHAAIEEEIFYPATAKSGEEGAEQLVEEAQEEHATIKTLLEEIDALDSGADAECDAKMIVLKDSVLRHAEEEEREIFPVFEELDKNWKAKVADQLISRKRALEEEAIEESDESEEPE